jgi:dTDP-4-amino-4,6-dideoxygalactose transaminase
MPVRSFGEEELALLKEVLDSGRLSVLAGGKMQGRFEKAFAEAHGAKYAVAMNSAMSVLHTSLIAAGVEPGDEVICDPVCVFGAQAVLYQRGKPVFVDCEPVTFNMDPDQLEERITDRTKAIIVTHVGGLPARMDRVMRVARKHKLLVIEDCAHAFLATYKGKYAGTWGDIGSFSFQASKQLGLGDGGMALTNKKKLADALALHAGAPTFMAVAHGVHYNFRMNEQTAAIGLAQLPKITRACRELIKIGRLWDKAIADCPWLLAQQAPEGAQSTYHLWVATFEGEQHGISRERFVSALKAHQVPFSVGYTNRAAYQHPVFDKVFPKGTYPQGLCPNAEHMVPRMVLGYPMIPLDQAKRVADGLRKLTEELA